MDAQSSSGLLGIQQAYHMLKCGMVDAVIVAGVNLVLNPHFNIMFKKLNMLSPEGKCKVFDADGRLLFTLLLPSPPFFLLPKIFDGADLRLLSLSSRWIRQK